MDLWERGIHAGLVGDAEAEGAARVGRDARGLEEEDDVIAWKFHRVVLIGKLSKAISWSTYMEGEGYLLSDDRCTKTRRPVMEFLCENHLDT